MVQSKSGTDLAAVSAKFGVRNPKEEIDIAQALSDTYHTISTGSALSGNLNFPRRTISAYFNSAVASVFKEFKNAVYHALDTFHITAPVYILKADGGSLPIDTVESIPVETVFTGPAATVLGLEALRSTKDAHTVALDIGGTTTDISLWKQGKPLMTKEGVSIRDIQVLYAPLRLPRWALAVNRRCAMKMENSWSALNGLAHLLHWVALSLH